MRSLLTLLVLASAAVTQAAEPVENPAVDAAGSTSGETQAATEVASSPRGVIRLDETVISGNQELPKVLYILPWRDPNGLPEIDLDARHSELDVFRRLYPPAYRRELTYFESLEAAKSSLDTAKSSEE